MKALEFFRFFWTEDFGLDQKIFDEGRLFGFNEADILLEG